MPPQERFHLREIDGLRIRFRERHVDVVVQDHDEPRFGGEREDAIEGRVLQACGLAVDFSRDEFLVDAELADAREDTGKRLQHATDVIDAVHVGRVEAGDHRVETPLLLSGQRAVHARDVGVGERVVVERCVAVQVIRGREVTRVRVRPLLLQRDTEQRRAANARPHDLQKVGHLDALLDVVGQMEMRIVKLPGVLALRPRRREDRAGRGGREQKTPNDACEGWVCHGALEVHLEVEMKDRALGTNRVGIRGVSNRRVVHIEPFPVEANPALSHHVPVPAAARFPLVAVLPEHL
jgi:hypothetical protein